MSYSPYTPISALGPKNLLSASGSLTAVTANGIGGETPTTSNPFVDQIFIQVDYSLPSTTLPSMLCSMGCG